MILRSLLHWRAFGAVCALASFSAGHGMAEDLVAERWQGLSAGAHVMQSGRWSMTQGDAESLRLVDQPGGDGLVLSAAITKPVPIVASVDRFTLSEDGLAMEMKLILSEEMTGASTVQFGFRGADSGGAPLADSFRVRISPTEIFLNRFPARGKGDQKVLGRYAVPADSLSGSSVHTVLLRILPRDVGECQLEVRLNGVEVMRVTSRVPDASSAPGLGQSVRGFFIPGEGALIKELRIEKIEE